MHMYHFHRYTHTALSVSYGTVYTCPMGRLQRWCMYLVVCDAVLVIIIIIIKNFLRIYMHIYIYIEIHTIHKWVWLFLDHLLALAQLTQILVPSKLVNHALVHKSIRFSSTPHEMYFCHCRFDLW